MSRPVRPPCATSRRCPEACAETFTGIRTLATRGDVQVPSPSIEDRNCRAWHGSAVSVRSVSAGYPGLTLLSDTPHRDLWSLDTMVNTFTSAEADSTNKNAKSRSSRHSHSTAIACGPKRGNLDEPARTRRRSSELNIVSPLASCRAHAGPWWVGDGENDDDNLR